MKILSLAAVACSLGLLQAYAVPAAAADAAPAGPPGERRIWMTVGERRLPITLADNSAARAFAAQLPLTLDMPDLNGNEKHAKLPKALPQAAMKPGTVQAGDLMLWGANTLVVFYLTFDTPYSYTRLGAIEDPAALAQVLGRGAAKLTFSGELK
ncbi:MAG: cyclophilin-like fold protein [Burkholderiales bacterium]